MMMEEPRLMIAACLTVLKRKKNGSRCMEVGDSMVLPMSKPSIGSHRNAQT